MNKLLMFLVLMLVACGGAEFQDDPFPDGNEAGAPSSGGSVSVAGSAGTSSTAGTGADAGAAGSGSTSSSGGSVGMPTAGSGGQAPTTCDGGEPAVVLPAAFQLDIWNYTDGEKCADAVTAPIACDVTWGTIERLDGYNFRARLEAVDCGAVQYVTGYCDSVDMECNTTIKTSSFTWVTFTVVKDGGVFKVDATDATDYIGIEGEELCGGGPEDWDGRAISDVNNRFRAILRDLTFSCSEN